MSQRMTTSPTNPEWSRGCQKELMINGKVSLRENQLATTPVLHNCCSVIFETYIDIYIPFITTRNN